MFNIFVKKYNHIFLKLSIRVSIFFICYIAFIADGNLKTMISVAKASSLIAQHHENNENYLLDILNVSALKNHYEAPRVNFLNKEGAQTNFRDFRNNFLIVYLWASWSTDSTSELIKLQSLYQEFQFKDINNIKILPISLDFKSYDQLQTILQKKGITIEFYLDSPKQLMQEFGFHALPQRFLINEEGQVISHIKKPIDWNDKTVIKYLSTVAKPRDQKKQILDIRPEADKEDSSKKELSPEKEVIKKHPIIIG